MQPEAKFKRKLVQAFEEVFPQAWTAYVKALNKDGVPDLLLCRPGAAALWLEAKVGDNDLSSAQQLALSNMDSAGQRALFIRCSDMSAPSHQRTLSIGLVVPRSPVRSRPWKEFRVLGLFTGHWADLKTRAFWERVYNA